MKMFCDRETAKSALFSSVRNGDACCNAFLNVDKDKNLVNSLDGRER